MKIEIKIIDKQLYSAEHKGMDLTGECLPQFATYGSCAMDLISAEDVTLIPGETKKIKTGLAIHTGSYCKTCNKKKKKHGVAALILPRSGLGSKGLVLANTVGLIDEDYQGELIISAWNRQLPIVNHCADKFPIINIKRGDRIAQLMFTPVIRPEWEIVKEFSNDTDRGEGGFGSSGK